MTTLLRAIARTPRRIRLVFDGATAAVGLAGYALARADGALTTAAPIAAFNPDPQSVELATSEDLLSGVAYTVTTAQGAATCAWTAPAAQPRGLVPEDDPEAEAFGVDWDWLAPALDASGDLPVVRGLPCLKHDLVAIAQTHPGELFHRPAEGAGLVERINGPGALATLAASVRAQWQTDPRVRAVEATTTLATDGTVSLRAAVTTPALDAPLPLLVRPS